MAAVITLLTGTEELLVQRAIRTVVDHAAVVAQEVTVVHHSADELTDDTWDHLLAPSLFPYATVLVLTSLADAPSGLADRLVTLAQQRPKDFFVVLHQRGVAGKKLLDTVMRAPHVARVNCAVLKTRREKLRFLKEEFRHNHRRATEQAVDYLLDAVGADLQALVSAVDQLVNDTQGLIDSHTVEQYYQGRAEVSGFVVADRALEGHPGPALEQLRWALASGTDPVLIVSALASGLRMLVAVASGTAGAGGAAVAVPSWKVDQLRRQVRGWTPYGIAAALAHVVEADAAIKGAGADPAYALELAVLQVCALRR